MIATAIQNRTAPLRKIIDEEEQRALQQEAGRKAIIEACGNDFVPPRSLVGAAEIIKKLRADLRAAASSAEEQRQALAAQSSQLVAAVRAELNATISGLREEIARANATRDAFYANVRATLTERGMMEIPGLAGYFTGATPLQCAAEGAAVYVTRFRSTPEKIGVQGEYLRRRGWRMVGNGSWIGPDGANSLPLDSAILKQVQADVAPFQCFAKLAWVDKKAARWEGKPATPVAPPALDPAWENFEIEPDSQGETESLPLVADEVEAYLAEAETPVIHMTQPIQPVPVRRPVDLGCITKVNGKVVDPNEVAPRRSGANGSSAETIVIPALR